jgi:phosphate transport system substrate-binding protein
VGQKGDKSHGVTQLLQQTKGGIAYIEENYADKNHLAVALIQNKAGKFVGPTADGVSAAASAAADQMHGDQLTASIWDQGGDKSYPISTFTYLIVYKDLSYVKDAAKAAALVDFLNWTATDGQAKAAALDYAPVGDAVSVKVKAAIASLTFGGKGVK